ncbi:MAG TPA: pyridoxamine 5'-phosphate oxidase family protein [Streptosporangiaceae bacterium]|jgi:hypothetical protein
MVAWREVVAAEPEFAAQVRQRFEAHRHKTLATLRSDGSPRISGTEAQFIEGDLWFGSMARALKALDLLRDPRFALHGPSVDPDDDNPSAWPGEAKLSGRAVEVTDRAQIEAVLKAQGVTDPGEFGDSHFFRLDIEEVVLTRLGDPADHLVIQLWTPGGGLRSFQRK